MLVRPGFGETLPALLRRRHGIPERRTALGAGIVVALLAVVGIALYDPLKGKTQRVHRDRPVFNTLYTEGVVRPVAPRPGELQRYEAGRGRLRLELAIRPTRLPPYRGDVSGILPIVSVPHVRRLAARLPAFELTDEGKARVGTAPGYQVGFRYGPPGRRSTGRDVIVVPADEPGARDGILISLRETRPPQVTDADRQVLRAMRSAFRSFKYGADRDD